MMPTSMRPFHKTLIWQIAIVACLTLIGKFGAFGKDVLLSYIFGAGSQTDAYFVANAIPGLVFAGFFATIGLVFLPIYTRAGLQSENSVQAVVHTGVGLYMTVSASLTALTLLFADVMVGLVAPKAPPDVLALAGLLTFSRILKWLFTNYKNYTLAVLTGFIIGSLNKIWPWKETLSYMTDRHGEQKPLEQINLLPQQFEGDSQLIAGIVLAIVGFALIFVLEGLGKQFKKA